MSKDLQMIYKMILKHGMKAEDVVKGWFELQDYIEEPYRSEKPKYVRMIMKYRSK